MRTSFLAGLALLLSLPSARASACSCIAPPPPLEALASAAAVFEGRVVEIEEVEASEGPVDLERVRVTFEVVQQWKGVETERVTVHTMENSAACGVPFARDTSWLVYASARGEALSVSLCSRTQRIEEAQEDLAALEAGVVPVEITEQDEVEPQAPATPPHRAGCASCHVGAAPAMPGPFGIAALVVGTLMAGNRTRRRLSTAARADKRSGSSARS